MSLQDKKILLTGAAGGIGRLLALELATKGARLALVERDMEKAQAVCAEITALGGVAHPLVADLSTPAGLESLVPQAWDALNGLDVLVNNAGIMDFTRFEQQDKKRIELTINTNVTAAILLTRDALPLFLKQGSGQIVNIGSALGAIGLAHYATYCASKFAMRGFSESLRRELADSGIAVTYIAPRATKTPLNSENTVQMMKATGTAMDDPEQVAKIIAHAIEQQRKEILIGQPEGFFAKLNGILPRIVDMGLKQKTRIAREFTGQ